MKFLKCKKNKKKYKKLKTINHEIKYEIPRLPPEIIVHISTYLNIEDKLKLRLINKEFKATFDYLIRLDQLTLIQSKSRFNLNWFYTNRSNETIDLIEFNNKNILIDLFKKDLFLNVKKLFFCSKEINLDRTINQLKYLEELNIECNLESNSILSLSKLRILKIKLCNKEFKIQLETPSLSALKCSNLENYQFNYPEKIIYLDTQSINKFRSNQLNLFRNLEFIFFYNIRKLERMKLILIELFELDHLKELHFIYESLDRSNLTEIIEFYKLKLELKLDNLKIFLSGIDYENLKSFNRDQLTTSNQLKFILKRFSKTIDILPFIEKINFHTLVKLLNLYPNVSLDNVIYKFPNIKSIRAYGLNKENIDYFYEFLSKFNSLVELKLNLELDYKIYKLNRLPESCKRITYLFLYNFNVYKLTDLDFLYKFDKLYFLYLGKLDDLNILKNLSDNLNIYIDCQFIYKNNPFIIRYKDNVYTHDKLKFNSTSLFQNFDSIINWDFSDSF